MRRYAQGPLEGGDLTSFRVWAEGHRSVDLVIDGIYTPMLPEANGHFHVDAVAPPGTRYGYRVDGKGDVLPDPASYWQPDGPDALSCVTALGIYQWLNDRWPEPDLPSAVIYEMHIGTFTPEGTWRAAMEHLPFLSDIGVTLIEMMPIACFAGTFGWGYDAALPYAPSQLYGTPDDLRAFVDAAHGFGLNVILDVVYNHVGFSAPQEHFSSRYFSDSENDWGKGINFDGPSSGPTRAYFRDNARYWIGEFRFDGLRFDAVQAIKDTSEPHILSDIITTCRKETDRDLVFIGENERQEAAMVRPPASGGIGMDAVWNDDYHHSIVAALTGRHEAYYHDTPGRPQELAAALRHGFLFQGQRYDWQDKGRGTPALDIEASRFVHFLDNHDQIANSGLGQRMHQKTSPARMRAATALLLLGRQTPMLFQGQEFMASAPFCYFLDQKGDLGAAVKQGRVDELAQFPSMTDADLELPDPLARETFERCKLNWAEVETHAEAVRLHRDLLELRRSRPALRRAHTSRHPSLDASVIGPEALLIRFFGATGIDDLLLLCNFGRDQFVASIPDPLAAPPEGQRWRLAWSSEEPRYGGAGQAFIDPARRFFLQAETVMLLGI